MPLPEKDFFTLAEIAERWGCDDAVFLSYANQDILTYSVYLRDLGSYRTIEETEDERITRDHTIAFSMVSPDYKWHSIRYLRSDDARRVLESRSPEEVAVSVLYKSPQRTKEHGTGYMQAHYFTRADLIISREMRDHFEETNQFIIKPGWLARRWNWLREAENQKPIAILGGGVAAITAAAWTALQWWIKVNPTP